MRLSLLFPACLLLGTTACTKVEQDFGACPGNCTVIQGQLVTAGGNEALRNVPLTLEWKRNTYYIRQKASGRTDANGNFQLRFLMKDDELSEGYFTVQYNVKTNDYYLLDHSSIVLPDLKRDTTVSLGRYLVPRKAYVELRITNQQDIGGDSYWSNFSSPYGTVSTIGPFGGGPAVDWRSADVRTGWIVPVPGDQPIVVNHVKNRNGVRFTSADTIYVPRGTRQQYTVTF